MFKDLPSGKCSVRVGGACWTWDQRGLGSIPNWSGIIFYFKFCNPNLHNIARSERIRFKTKNPIAGIIFQNFEILHETKRIFGCRERTLGSPPLDLPMVEYSRTPIFD